MDSNAVALVVGDGVARNVVAGADAAGNAEMVVVNDSVACNGAVIGIPVEDTVEVVSDGVVPNDVAV